MITFFSGFVNGNLSITKELAIIMQLSEDLIRQVLSGEKGGFKSWKGLAPEAGRQTSTNSSCRNCHDLQVVVQSINKTDGASAPDTYADFGGKG